MKRKLQIAALVLLALAFWGVGVAIHLSCEGRPTTHFGWVSVAGYDSEGYLNFFCNIHRLFSGSFRHPLLTFESFPSFLVGGMLADRLGRGVAKIGVLGVYGVVGALCVLLLWQIARRLRMGRLATASVLALWLSFAHVWIVGGIAESFGPSLLLLLATVLMFVQGVRDWRAWAALAAVCGGMTLTNGVKPVLAWLVGVDRRDFSVRTAVRIAVCGLAVAAAGAVALMVKWAFVDGLGVVGGARTIVHDIAECLPASLGLTPGRQLWHVWHGFWCEPMMLHGPVVASDGPVSGYATFLPHVFAGALLLLCVYSAVVNFRRPVVRVALAMVSVDVLLHVFIGWGVNEAQIYSAHWLWCVPLLVGLLPGRLPAVGLPLAAGIAAHNLSAVLWA